MSLGSDCALQSRVLRRHTLGEKLLGGESTAVTRVLGCGWEGAWLRGAGCRCRGPSYDRGDAHTRSSNYGGAVDLSDDEILEREMNPLGHLSPDVDHSLNAVLANRDMSAMALACYARWWQLETWMRSAVYLELRSRDGADWASNIAGSAHTRQKGDERYQYMASPDWADPLAYLDASKLFAVAEENWDLFAPILPHKPVWLGRVHELLAIRNRIGHLRRPHVDDLGKLLQTLRDLERGALLSCCAYNEPRGYPVSDDDPVWQAYREDSFTGAADLCQHSDLRYGTAVVVSYTLRPWAERAEDEITVTGYPGAIWQVAFYPRGRDFDIRKFWAELTHEARKLLLHVTISTGGTLRVTFPAVESSESLSRAIGDAITSSMRSYPASAGSIRRPEHLPPMDSRVLLNTALAWVCSDYTPITLFSA